MTKYVAGWFQRGDEDLAAAGIILEKAAGSPNPACFHAQQAAEKYLKGFLAHHDLHVRKIHDLESLLEDCEKVDPSFAELQGSASFLSQFYTASRYPDDFVEFRREDAEKALEAACRVQEFVSLKVKPGEVRGGFSPITVIAVGAVIAGLVIAAGGGFFAYQRLFAVSESHTPVVGEEPITAKGTKSIDTSTWKTYRSEQYGFEVKYPSEWSVGMTADGGINIYPRGEGPFSPWRDDTHVSIFPEGVGIHSRPTNAKASQEDPTPEDEKSSIALLTHTGELWGFTITFDDPPRSWGESGFVWAGVELKDVQYVCGDQSKSREQCDPFSDGLTMRGAITQRGMEDLKIVRDIVATFRFVR